MIKLLIKFPLKTVHKIMIWLSFVMRFLAVLLAANRDILLEKWEPTEGNPISKSIDITYNEDMLTEYYARMKMSNNK